MNIAQIEENIQKLLANSSQEKFIFDLLEAFGKPKASIKRLQSNEAGSYNLAKNPNEVLWKKNLYFKAVAEDALYDIIDSAKNDSAIAKHDPRFIIVTNFNKLLSVDTKTGDSLDIDFVNLHKNFDFFLPWAGMEKAQYKSESLADVKAAEKMARLFDLLKHDNPSQDPKAIHSLNVFLSRLLFCFFAESTEIFTHKQFTNNISSHTAQDGSDLAGYLEKLFQALNTEDRKAYPEFLKSFPYVNGGLFADHHSVPAFTAKSRRMLIECGSELDWSEINPDIFGSMFQAVVHPDQRGNMGMHYTSVPNIMKVIEPLFLNDLFDDFKKNFDSPKKLELLLQRLSKIKVFDPACGSGNFLIIAYKEIRKLEMEIFNRMKALVPQMALSLSGIQLSQFYGIELDDFAHEVAILSLWLAEHQMNIAFKSKFGQANPSLPLTKGGNIVCDNAIRVDWKKVCLIHHDDEIYILGNPPYLGSNQQNSEQKKDMEIVCGSILSNYKKLDYIACWFIKGAMFIKGYKSKYSFVSTNSICQGEQVALLWPFIFNNSLEIDYAYESFKWSNNAKYKAGVTCVIVGVRNKGNSKKFIYSENGLIREIVNISPYLVSGKDIIVYKRSESLSDIPQMCAGNKPVDGGHLIFSDQEYVDIVNEYPSIKRYFKRFIGSNEFINGERRWCLWIHDEQLNEALRFPPITKRVKLVREMRLASPDEGANAMSLRSHQFRDFKETKTHSIVIPSASSERRTYLPIGFISSDTIVSNLAHVIYEAEPYIFGIISSKIHCIWIRTVCGQLETRIRYSSVLGYNTFPFPSISKSQKIAIEQKVFQAIAEREKYPDKCIADLYDPDLMPADLLRIHQEIDEMVDECYRKKPFANDEERLEHLFALYEKMTEKEIA